MKISAEVVIGSIMSPHTPTRVVLLSCGSFNPLTHMHLRMFEIAKDYLHRIGTCEVVGGVISPVHDAYGKDDLVPSTHRLEMINLALQNNDWIRLSDWECRQESWSKTKQSIQYHQNFLNALCNQYCEDQCDINENELKWVPDSIKSDNRTPIKIKLLCGADLLESFGRPGLWADEDIEEIVGRHGLLVVTRMNSNPAEFIYNSDLLTKYMGNISIITEWITNEISSTKIRRALKRHESVRYLLPDKVLDYIFKNNLYGTQRTYKYLPVPNNTILTPSPGDISMESPSPTNCIYICNNNLFTRQSYDKRVSIDTVDNFIKPGLKHPGQAVKIITESTGETRVVDKEVRKEDKNKVLSTSKSFPHFNDIEEHTRMKRSESNSSLKECKSCDENLIKFIFTKHGIQVISDVETIV